MKRIVAHLVDAAFNRYAPTVHGRNMHVFTTEEIVGPDWQSATLADAKADEPLVDLDGNPDLPAGAGPHVAPPLAAEASATASAGSPSCTSDATAADLKVITSRVLRDCAIQWPATTADVVVRELLHHFDFHHKK